MKLMDYSGWKPSPEAIQSIRTQPVPRSPKQPGPLEETQVISLKSKLPIKQQSQVVRYQQWLATQAARRSNRQEREDYRTKAEPAVLLDGKAMTMYAPYRPAHNAYQTFTNPQIITLILLLVAVLALEVLFGYGFLAGVIGAVTALYAIQLLITGLLLAKASQTSIAEQIPAEIIDALKGSKWPTYTILCPLYKEAAVIAQFLDAMRKIDYPRDKLQILLLCEEVDHQTISAIKRVAPSSPFELVVVPNGGPRTKPRACNYGLMHATGQYVVIYDAEDVPEPLQLKKAVLTFANHGTDLACVQAQLNFYNATQNLLTRLFTIEYTSWFTLTLPALSSGGLALPLGGTSNHFQTSILRGLGGWDAFNVTEDCDLGMRLASQRIKLKTAIVESVTLEEANSNLKNWIRQRSRWIKGYMQTYLVYMRRPFTMLSRDKRRAFFSLQLIIGTAACTYFLNPVMWILTLIYILDRHQVEPLYHILFPAPTLYAGMICLIFGNFFYIYSSMVACVRKQQYSLVPLCLLMPFYWVLMCIAACMGLWELFTNPHYWHKTRHGLHLKSRVAELEIKGIKSGKAPVSDMLTAHVPAVAVRQVGTITEHMAAIVTLPIAAIRGGKQRPPVKVRDFWLPFTLLVATITSIGATTYYFNRHELLLFGDAYGHMMIARRTIDSLTPGIAQLGTVWLPLPHLLMLPLIWNGFLWRTGLVGAIPSMICYILSAFFLYKSIKRITRQGVIALLGTCLFLFSPNILYLQSTPLSEVICIVCLIASCYGFLIWIETGTLRSLIGTGVGCFFATIARYDGWAMFAAITCAIVFVCLIKKMSWRKTVATTLIFCVIGGIGIFLWFVWNQILFGDPLYFQHGPFAAATQQMFYIHLNLDAPYHQPLKALTIYSQTTLYVVGPALCCLGLLALCVRFLRIDAKNIGIDLGLLTFLSPFVFYVLALYGGSAIIFIPHLFQSGTPQLFNVRYGAQMVAPLSILAAVVVNDIAELFKRRGILLQVILLTLVIAAQSIWSIQQPEPIVVTEGTSGTSCTSIAESSVYLAEHYSGGEILADSATTDIQAIVPILQLSFRDVIYEGNNTIWQDALQDPSKYATWILVNATNDSDITAQKINIQGRGFLSQYQLVAKDATGGTELFHKIGSPMTEKPAPAYFSDYKNNSCSTH